MSKFITLLSQGSRWDSISQRAYGDPYRFPEVIRANPNQRASLVVPDGVRLSVAVDTLADIQANDTANLPPWKR